MIFVTAFIFWAIIHSIMASAGFKSMISGWVGERTYDGLYRLVYNVLATVTFLPVIWLIGSALPDRIMWQLPRPFSFLFVLIQVIGLLGLFISLLQTDLLRFAGIGQAYRFLRGDKEVNPSPALVIGGPYNLVRHPLYFFSLLILWFLPIMTIGTLLFNILATLYFWIGSVYEERRLISQFGAAYRDYQQHVPRLIPIKISK